MKKYITVAALLAAGSAFVNAEVTIHGTTFTPPSVNALHNAYTTSDIASEANALISGNNKYYTNGNKGYSYGGFYVASDAGLKFNHTEVVTVTYLYIDKSITMKTGDDSAVGKINWSNTAQGEKGIFKISGDVGAWLDINANYGANISLAGMNDSSSVYLNTFGQLTTNSGSIYATALTDKAVAEASSAYAVEGDSVVRTLLKGDYSSWNGTVVLDGVSEYNVIKDASGLKVSYVIPEPSTFGLLAGLGALALVGTRRRRR